MKSIPLNQHWTHSKKERHTIDATFFYMVLLAFFCALTLSSGAIDWSNAWQGFVARVSGLSTAWNPIIDERLPRLMVLVCSGASLATSGAVMQALFQNPLASPSVLGISCGGTLLVIVCFLLGITTLSAVAIPCAAIMGCFAVLLAVYLISRKLTSIDATGLLLVGIALASLLLALQGTLLYAFRDNWGVMQAISEWENGSAKDKTWMHVHLQVPLTLIGCYVALKYRRELNILALGEEEALNLGVDVSKVRWRLFLAVALLTGGTLATMGVIAFYGLILPHLLRKLHGACHLKLIPYCLWGGAGGLLGIDLITRLLHLTSLSIATVSALLGSLFLFILLIKGSWRHA